MRTGVTDITVILDRSGSMGSRVSDTIGGFNAFLDEQRRQPGLATLSLVQFDDEYEPNYSATPLAEVPRLTEMTYVPRGSTALLNAIFRTIVDTGSRYDRMPEAERPEKVIVLIITDGMENASHGQPPYASYAQVAALIDQQRTVYQWQVLFMGSNQDAIATAAQINIPAAQAVTYSAGHYGTQRVYDIMSDKVAAMRSSSIPVAAMASVGSFTSSERVDVATPDGEATSGPNQWIVTPEARTSCTCGTAPSRACPLHGAAGPA